MERRVMRLMIQTVPGAPARRRGMDVLALRGRRLALRDQGCARGHTGEARGLFQESPAVRLPVRLIGIHG